MTLGQFLIGQWLVTWPLIGDLLPPPPGDEVHVEAEQEGDGDPRTLLPEHKSIDRFLTILSKTIFKDIKLPFLRFLKLPAPQYELFKLLLLFQGTTIPAKVLMIYIIYKILLIDVNSSVKSGPVEEGDGEEAGEVSEELLPGEFPEGAPPPPDHTPILRH